jgi:hypothetical protein
LIFLFVSRLLILLQRRKKYKTRTILGYKTLAEGVIRMDAVLQKSMDMTVELTDTGKSGRPGFPIATIRATQVSSSPVDQDNKNNNSVLISGELREIEMQNEILNRNSNVNRPGHRQRIFRRGRGAGIQLK